MLGQKKIWSLANRPSSQQAQKKIKWGVQQKKIQRQILSVAELIKQEQGGVQT